MTTTSSVAFVATEEQLRSVREDLPEIDLIESDDIREKVTLVFASLLNDGPFGRVSECPGLVKNEPATTVVEGWEQPKYDLARHSRHVALNALAIARNLKDVWGIESNHDVVLASALLHDVSKLVEFEDHTGQKSPLGKSFVHGMLGGIRCYQVGLPLEIAQTVVFHNFTPPHTTYTPKTIEYVIVTYADHAAADPISFTEGKPTHFEFKKRFFTVD